jgi:hypothetical protein
VASSVTAQKPEPSRACQDSPSATYLCQRIRYQAPRLLAVEHFEELFRDVRHYRICGQHRHNPTAIDLISRHGQKRKTRLVPSRALRLNRNFGTWFPLPRLGSATLTRLPNYLLGTVGSTLWRSLGVIGSEPALENQRLWGSSFSNRGGWGGL